MASLSNFDQRQTFNTKPKTKELPKNMHLRADNCPVEPIKVAYIPQVGARECSLRQDFIPVFDVVNAVASVFAVNPAHLLGPRRARKYAKPRQVVMYICRKYCPHLSLPQIGQFLGGRDHTTIMYGSKKIEKDMQFRPELMAQISVVKKLLGIAP